MIMGYTHYWRGIGTPDREAYGRTLADAKQIVEEAGRQDIRLANGLGEPGSDPELSEGQIVLNGLAPDEDYETFHFEAVPGNSFCKTREPDRPYDAVVNAILIRAKVHYGDALSVSSDGDWSDWARGVQLVKDAFGVDAECPWEDDE
jgi:hypothetical protein